MNLFIALVLIYLLWSLLGNGITAFDSHPIYITTESVFFLLLALTLSLLNWTLEGVKWSLLMNKIKQLSFMEILISICLGAAANFIAPNRTGDLIGRMRFIPKGKRWQAAYINFFTGMSQLFITFLAGVIAVYFSIEKITQLIDLKAEFTIAILLVIISLSVYFYFSSNLLFKVFHLLSKKNPLKDDNIGFTDRGRSFLLSIGRYCVFAIQFYLVLLAFGQSISLIDSSLCIALIYFFNSFIPSNWMVEVLAKGGIAFFVFNLFGFDPMLGLSSTFVLWLLNLLLPSLLGILFLQKVKWLSLIKLKS